MRETQKAVARRKRDPMYAERYFAGHGIDVGAGEAPLGNYRGDFPKMGQVYAWDVQDGDAQYLANVASDQYDFVHSSHCLEHLADPRTALSNWIRVLKPGGYLVVTVPDEDLYEHGVWPSRFNADHKWSFTICKRDKRNPRSLNVVDLVEDFSGDVECERLLQVRDNFRDDAAADVDQTLGEAECAIEWVWRKRAELTPQNTRWLAHLDEGLRASQEHDWPRAEAALRAACEAPGAELAADNALAVLLTMLHRYDEAEQAWRAAVKRVGGKQARILLSLTLLMTGQWREGFRLRESSLPDARRTSVLPPEAMRRWMGESLENKSIALWTEAGLGDEIMFARFAAVLKEQLKARRVVLVCQKPIARLLREGLEGPDAVFSADEANEAAAADFWVFPHSLPIHLDLTPEDISGDPYLAVPASRAAQWQRRVSADARAPLRVGVAWHGDPTHENDPQRSFSSLDAWASLLSVEGVHFFSVQVGAGAEAARAWAKEHENFTALGHEFADFSDTAAALSQMDLVITVDTSIVHAAGALGRPTWLMLPAVFDWRWLVDREDSPWYSSVRIFRQEYVHEWSAVLVRARAELVELAKAAHLAKSQDGLESVQPVIEVTIAAEPEAPVTRNRQRNRQARLPRVGS